MKPLLYLIIISMSLASCKQAVQQNDTMEFFDFNQEQFTFLVFDKSRIDTFMTKFDPLEYSNELIKRELIKLTQLQFENNPKETLPSFDKNSEKPDVSDRDIAVDAIKTTYDKDGDEHFSVSLAYLFFYNCLPDCFQNKWTQSIIGDFRFNSIFFAILRDNSEIIDKMIFSEIIYRDEKLAPIFGEHIFNEITPDNAKQIKELIVNDKSFDDVRFKTDRDNFIYFLDKTISGEWRLILTDWN